jgi:hypothetical protein
LSKFGSSSYSTLDDEEDKLQCEEQNCNYFIAKEFRKELLRDSLKKKVLKGLVKKVARHEKMFDMTRCTLLIIRVKKTIKTRKTQLLCPESRSLLKTASKKDSLLSINKL